jgi:voltage-gated potassium channel
VADASPACDVGGTASQKLSVMRNLTTEQWERATDVPLIVAALAFLAAYAIPILKPDLPSWAAATCIAVVATAWALFVVDYVVRLRLAPDRRTYVRKHVVDLLVIALPLLRPLRLLRLLVLFSVLNRRIGSRLRGRLAVYTGGTAALLALCAALGVLSAERGHEGANINSFGDSIWWAITTMTTVGYGDRYPVTGLGRAIAAMLMVGGIALLGVVTATLASWLIEAVEADQQETYDMKNEIRTLHRKLDQLLGGQSVEPSPAPSQVSEQELGDKEPGGD